MAKIYRLFLLFFVFAMTAFGQAASRYDGVLIDQNGKPVVGMNVRVCTTPATGQPCTPLANVYTNSGLTFPAQNPLTTDFLGNFYFYVTSGIYELEFSGPGIITKQVPDVTITVPQNNSNPVFTSVTATTATIGTINGFVYVDGTINTTIAGAIAALPSTGGTVIIPCGTYTLSTTLVIPSQVILQGCGTGSTTSGGTRLIAASGSVSPVVQVQGTSSTSRSGDIFLRDLSIVGVYTASQVCMQIDHATYIVQDHVQYLTCGQAEWDNDVYRSLHTDVTYFQSGSGGTNTTATVRVENISNPSVPTEQVFFIDCSWQGDAGGKQGTSVYYGPATEEGRISHSKLDYSGTNPNFPIVYINQAQFIDITHNTISGFASVAPSTGTVTVTGSNTVPSFGINISDNTLISFSATVPGIYLQNTNNYTVNGGFFVGPNSTGTAIVTTTSTGGGTIASIQMGSSDTEVNNSSGSAAAIYYGQYNSGAFNVQSNAAFTGPLPWIDVTAVPYNAKCDGHTDDSAALQAAGNAAIAAGAIMQLPTAGTCIFGTTLTFTHNSPDTLLPSIHIRGGGISTILKYTGTGNAIVITSGVSGHFIYNPTLEHFQLWGGLAAPAQTAIQCQYCNQGVITDVQVYGLQNYDAQLWGFTVGFDLTNAAGMAISSSGFNDCNVGMKLLGTELSTITGGFGEGVNISFLMGTGGGGLSDSGVYIINGLNYETQNYFMVWNDTMGTPTVSSAEGVYVLNNTIVFDQDGGGSGYTPNQVLNVLNSSGSTIQLKNIVFSNNFFYCNTTCSYAFNLSMASGGDPFINRLTINGNVLYGFTTAGLTANNSVITGLWSNNINENISTPTLTAVTGTGVFCVDDWYGGLAVLCPETIDGALTVDGNFSVTGTGSITGNTTIGGTLGVTGIVTTPQTTLGRIRVSQGSEVSSGNFVLSGWGTSPVVTPNDSAEDTAGEITITSGTGSPSANPTVVLTFADGAFFNAPQCVTSRGDIDSPSTAPFINTTTTTTAITWTFVGTPVASTNYVLQWICMGH